MKCKRDSDGRKHDHHTLQIMRQQAVKAVANGQSPKNVAAAFGINIVTLYKWLSRYASGGQNALLAKPIPGRPPKISEAEMKWIANAVKDNTPMQHKFEFGLWTLALIKALIQRQFGKELSQGSVSRIMKILGFTVQKPLYQAWQQDAVLVREWETETYQAIKVKAAEQGATIYFVDESGLRSDYHTGTTWAPCGETPVVSVTGRRFSINMISAVNPQGKFRFMLQEGTVNASVFKTFLERLMIGETNPVFVIADGHPIHKAKMIRDYIASQNGKLQLYFLPPYAPQLNPDEQVWAHVKRSVSKQLVQSFDEMKSLALSALRRIQKLPDIVKGFFQQQECQYAAA